MKHKLLYSILFFLLLSPVFLNAQCLPQWGNYMPITITNPNAVVLTNFQVKINVNTAALIGAGQMQASGNDIRFTDASCNNIHYWIESGINTASTFIWVKVPNIPSSGSTIINMYYSNVSALQVANGDSVFLFFDDFNTASLNPVKWTVRGTPSSLTQSASIMSLQGNSNWEYIRSNTTWNGPVVIESREYSVLSSAAMVLGYAGTDNRFTFRLNSTTKGTCYDPDVSSGNAWFNTAYPAVPHPSSAYNNFEIKTDLVGNIITISSFCNQTTSNCNTSVMALNQYTGTGYYVGFSSWSTGYIENVDWVFARSSVATQPTSSNSPPQPNIAIITSALSSNNYCVGSNVTVNFNAGGSYVAGNIFSAELSNAAGSFVSPVIIGTLNSSSSGPLSIAATIPVLTPSGSAYRIRVVSSTPVITGVDNGSNITINILPTVTASSSAPAICNGSSATLTASGATSYSWSSGGNSAIEIVSPVSSSTYTVTGTDVNGCVNTSTVSVTVNALPTVTANSTASSVCAGGNVTLTGAGAITYTWTGGVTDGLSFVPTITDTYTVTGTDGNGCMNSASTSVTVNALPVVTASSTANAVCAGGSVTLTGGGATTYSWTGGVTDGLSFVPAITDTYTVTGTDGNACMNTASISVTVNPLPVVALGADVVQCAGTTMLDAMNAGATYLWNDASTTQTITVSVSGTFYVDVTDVNGCIGSDTVLVTLNSLPTVALGADTTNCGALILDAGNVGSSYLWNDASTAQTLNATTSGTYYVEVTDANSCVSSDTIIVTVNTPPTVTGTAASSVVCVDDAAVVLTGSPVGGIWTGIGVTGSSFNPTTAGTGTHTLTYSFTDVNGCNGDGVVLITVNACVGVMESVVENAVTVFPNPNNGEFILKLNGNEFRDVIIFDALGQRVQNLYLSPGVQTRIRIEVPGVYFVEVMTSSGVKETLRVIVNE